MSKAKNQKNINAQTEKKAVETVAKEEKVATAEIEEIKEFVVSSEKTRSERKRRSRQVSVRSRHGAIRKRALQ